MIWDKDHAEARSQAPALAACAIACVLVLVEGDAHFLTSGDQIFHWAVFAYILFYLAIQGLARSWSMPVYNIILATLQLIACRLYTAAETPYNLVFLGIISTRAWSKLLDANARHPHHTALADALYIALNVELAYDGTRELLVAVIGAAFLGGLLLARPDEPAK